MVSITRSNWPGWGHTGPSVSDTTLCTKASCTILPALCDLIEAKKGRWQSLRIFLALLLHHKEGSKSKTRLFKVSNLWDYCCYSTGDKWFSSLTLSENCVRRACPPTPRRIQDVHDPRGETPYLCNTMPCNALSILNATIFIYPVNHSSSSLKPAVLRICSTSPFSALIFTKIFCLMIRFGCSFIALVCSWIFSSISWILSRTS
jgi:hypothetical protein